MIIGDTSTYPGFKNGFLCVGKINTNTSGVGTITITGKDYHSKCTGFAFTAVDSGASAAKMFSAQIVSIAYSNGTTTITIQANMATDSGTGTTDITIYDGDVYYTFWINDTTLPTDQSTNVTSGGL